ncbi:hypothetical protein N0V83_007976 [Neocucurbitaria cava]|uniref:Uncharacterized protein n=1 Tax=Neocucurbitaria cava TaxID=798079 RepID=A0A9W8Y5U7_9PLEO|nr:hypothetical protein N0V83_007976 [Neocucurbitaria cava]
MSFLRNILKRSFLPTKTNTSTATREYAHVHDIQIKYTRAPAPITEEKPGDEDISASMERNGIVSNEFLDFSASRGNDLRQAGLTDGCKWCLCVSRWKEAFDARSGDNDKKVPQIVLKATNERALESVSMDDLRKFAVDKE